jgi:predicted nucleic acid-binding protein
VSKIFWDTNVFIYLFEDHPQFSKPTIALRHNMLKRGDQLITSTMTLGEIQVKPRKTGNIAQADRYRNSISQVASIVSFDSKAADAYAVIRERTGIRGPDAIQLACASSVGVEVFITNDLRLHQVSVPGIHFITSLDRVPI